MVFYNKEWNGTGEIVVYSNYHRYWLDRERHIKNPLFDVYSGKILDLKEGKPAAIKYFYSLLDVEICPDVTICVVPSSNAENVVTGMTRLGEMLAKNHRVNRVYYLKREKSIDKLARGGRRDPSVHMQSIGTVEEMDISGEIVLLMDDVTTTGNSLYVCKEILMNHGAKTVEMFALGKAI
ncbi:MAG: phosphoribosyltransferase [Clostridiales bacterium]|nr:phosphoribosyltransferase [Clostridiales bacterium]